MYYVLICTTRLHLSLMNNSLRIIVFSELKPIQEFLSQRKKIPKSNTGTPQNKIYWKHTLTVGPKCVQWLFVAIKHFSDDGRLLLCFIFVNNVKMSPCLIPTWNSWSEMWSFCAFPYTLPGMPMILYITSLAFLIHHIYGTDIFFFFKEENKKKNGFNS